MLDIRNLIVSAKKPRKPKPAARDMKLGFLNWLNQFKFPACPDATSWEDCLHEFPVDPEDTDNPTAGARIRYAVRLYTTQNKYVISILESWDPRRKEKVFILCAHVNWKADERYRQKSIEEIYMGGFDDILRARHTLWAQTFREKELEEALNCAAVAILGHELVGEFHSEEDDWPIIPAKPSIATFPKREDDQA